MRVLFLAAATALAATAADAGESVWYGANGPASAPCILSDYSPAEAMEMMTWTPVESKGVDGSLIVELNYGSNHVKFWKSKTACDHDNPPIVRPPEPPIPDRYR